MFFCLLLLAALLVAPAAGAEDDWRPAPPASVTVEDVRNNDGTQLQIRWERSPDDHWDDPDRQRVRGYRIERAIAPAGKFTEIVFVHSPLDEFRDRMLRPRNRYLYRVTTVGEDDSESEPLAAAAAVRPQRWFFHRDRGWFLGITVVVSFWIILFIYLARKGVQFYIRKIAGLEAVDEAVGRATEMGRPILFVPGIQDMNQIQTIAGITILARVGRLAAEYDAKIEVPTSRSLVMTAARETLESSYLTAGRPDAYHEEMSYYVTDEQFGYVAYLTGYMSRQKPAACFYLGAFFAESLILAETGNSIGAIQIAGTAEPAQLPFFVAACDYTLIGEEFFAASAYLSGEPEQLGTLKGQDAGKIIGGSLLIVGCLIATIAAFTGADWAIHAERYIKFNILGTDEPPPLVIEAEPQDEGVFRLSEPEDARLGESGYRMEVSA